jgi:hypothetical protein
MRTCPEAALIHCPLINLTADATPKPVSLYISAARKDVNMPKKETPDEHP